MKPYPDINLEELEKRKEQNFKERLEFIKWYANWQKNVSNKEWSAAQKRVIDRKKNQSSTK